MMVKDNTVKLEGIQPIMRHAMKWADIVWKELGQECVITAGTEAVYPRLLDDETLNPKAFQLIHSAGSLHPMGLALDFRTRYFNDGGDNAADHLKFHLNHTNSYLDSGRFQVIQHKSHIHVEFEPNE
jgi:hypothetical protein